MKNENVTLSSRTEHYISCAKEQLLKDNAISPIAVITNDSDILILPIKTADTISKERSMFLARYLARSIKASYAVTLFEAWAVMANKGIDPNTLPSQSPDRIEVLQCSAEHRGGAIEFASWRIERDSLNKITIDPEPCACHILQSSNSSYAVGEMAGILDDSKIPLNPPKSVTVALDKLVELYKKEATTNPYFTFN